MCSTKILCYTRSSPMTMEVFPLDTSADRSPHLNRTTANDSSVLNDTSADHSTYLSDFVYPKPESLYLCTFSSRLSKIDFEKRVTEFLLTEKYDVFLLVVHIEGDSQQMYQYVNHLRIIIEQIENEVKAERKKTESQVEREGKLFVCLMLLPATMLFASNYHCYFLTGWDLHYLDSISPSVSTSKNKSSLMISDWFTQLCLQDTASGSTHAQSTLALLKELIGENIVPVVVARVYPGKDRNSSQICLHNRNQLIRSLFLECGIAEILCTRFHSYWNEQTMNEYLLTAANDIYWHHSTLSLADQMHVTLRFLFSNFIVYILKEVNTCYGLDMFQNQPSDADNKCLLSFLSEMLKFIPIPDISVISMYNDKDSDSRILAKELFQGSHSRFPLSHTMFYLLRAIVEHARQEQLAQNRSTGVSMSESMIVRYSSDNWKDALKVPVALLHVTIPLIL